MSFRVTNGLTGSYRDSDGWLWEVATSQSTCLCSRVTGNVKNHLDGNGVYQDLAPLGNCVYDLRCLGHWDGGHMSATESQLRIPDSAVDDPQAFEVARVWVAHGAEHVTLRFDAWKNPAALGIVLADLMRHLVNAYEQDMGLDRDATLRQPDLKQKSIRRQISPPVPSRRSTNPNAWRTRRVQYSLGRLPRWSQ